MENCNGRSDDWPERRAHAALQAGRTAYASSSWHVDGIDRDAGTLPLSEWTCASGGPPLAAQASGSVQGIAFLRSVENDRESQAAEITHLDFRLGS